MNAQAVILKKDKDKPIRNRHHWIFSGAVKRLPDFKDGAILPVRSEEGELLGQAYFNRKSSIIGRMLTFDERPPLEAVEANVDDALALREVLLAERTNACRLINGEGDNLPGLTVDRYNDVLVIQITTLGMEKLKPFILDLLIRKVSPRSIYERSNVPARREEGLSDFEGHLFGERLDHVEIKEDGLRFLVEIQGSQKTGFFLDLRDMRRLVRSLAERRTVLNCFCYTGAFSVTALAGGAARVDSVDSSERAIELAKQNFALNGIPEGSRTFAVDDVFAFLRRTDLPYDFIILDPPAFAKKKADVVQACRGYKDINRLALQKILSGGLLLTFSCSYYVDEALFQKVVFQAAVEARRKVRIIQRHHLACDHPINIYHPESDYLKSLVLHVQ